MNQKKENGQRMIVISLDAVGAKDLEYLKTLPNFSKLREQAAICDHVKSICPSLTYPAHATIVTGLKPSEHGVINNLCLQPNRRSPDWMWKRNYIKADTIYDAAMRKGYTTASILWPVTARSKILLNVPEIFANRKWQNQIMVSAWNGSKGYQVELMLRYAKMIEGVKQPQLDNFVMESCEYTIRKYNPDLYFIHFTDVDSNRHLYGVNAPEIKQALNRHDERLGRIVKALQETGDMSKTTIVVLGDHYQKDTHTIIYPNYYLKKAGLIRTVKKRVDGEVISFAKDYDFVAQHADGCCYIYASKEIKKKLDHPHLDRSMHEEDWLLQRLGKALGQIPQEMIKKIMWKDEIEELGADVNCVCMIEAKEGYYFQNDMEVPFCKVAEADHGKMFATHGYLADDENYDTFFMMTGYGVKAHSRVESMSLVDEAPTLARILKVNMTHKCSGSVIEEFLDK